jgi:hypothetical protein
LLENTLVLVSSERSIQVRFKNIVKVIVKFIRKRKRIMEEMVKEGDG